jgi:Protein of unknown function (DUF2591)
MKTSELTGAALDWAVAKCEHDELSMKVIQYPAYAGALPIPHPSTNWSQGGPIIEREGISVARRGGHSWSLWGAVLQDFEFDEEGPTPLIAAMRCYVASKLGDEIELPEELK